MIFLKKILIKTNFLAQYRNLWETQYKSIHGILFVIDSSDRLRFAVARDELWMLLDHKDLTTRKV